MAVLHTMCRQLGTGCRRRQLTCESTAAWTDQPLRFSDTLGLLPMHGLNIILLRDVANRQIAMRCPFGEDSVIRVRSATEEHNKPNPHEWDHVHNPPGTPSPNPVTWRDQLNSIRTARPSAIHTVDIRSCRRPVFSHNCDTQCTSHDQP